MSMAVDAVDLPESEKYTRGVKRLFGVNGEIGQQAVAALEAISRA